MYPKLKIGPGEAARIMTGAPIPEGADGVIMQERTDEEVILLRYTNLSNLMEIIVKKVRIPAGEPC